MRRKRLFPLVWFLSWLMLMMAVMGGGQMANGQEPKKEVPEPYRTFFAEAQKHVEEFPVVPVGTTAGAHELFTTRIDAKPIVVDSHRFGCVRFVAPQLEGKDMVWAFSVPPNWGHWYILPASGEMDGFQDWINADRLYQGFPAALKNPARLQTLAGSNFKAGETYILWFEGTGTNENPPMLSAAINFLEREKDKDTAEPKRWDADSIDKGLGLTAAAETEQVAYLESRGGKILMDERFFRRAYGKERMENLLFTRRHTVTTSDGFFISIEMEIPNCGTDPVLSDVVAAYGEADLVLTPKERQFYDQEGSKVRKGESAYYYDYVVFLVETKKGVERVRRVMSVASDVSRVRPSGDGLTWSDAPILTSPMRVFFRDRKLVAKIAYWGDSQAKLISGELPVETFSKEDNEDEMREELKYLGEGKWEYRMLFKDGQIARSGTYENHARHGVERRFYPDGKPQLEAPYVKGKVEGVVKQWKRDGTIRERNFVGGRPAQ